MVTEKQKLGDRGESLIRKKFSCLKCKRNGTLKPLIKNFKYANIILTFADIECKLQQIKRKVLIHFLGQFWAQHSYQKKKG